MEEAGGVTPLDLTLPRYLHRETDSRRERPILPHGEITYWSKLMLKAIVRTGVVVGAIGAAVYAARKYFATPTEKSADAAEGAVDSVTSTAKEINNDLARKDEHLTASLGNLARKTG
jgi:hypothetical protein